MSESTQYKSMLPWSDDSAGRFKPILVVSLVIVMVFGVIIPILKVPEISRQEREQLPPQLAKILKKKVEPPKPKPKPKPPEPKKEEPKPELPKPELPKPKPKPKPKPVVKATKEEREKAQEKVKKALGDDALQSLAALASAIPNVKLDTSSDALRTGGANAVTAGSVVDPNAVVRLSGGIDEGTLTGAVAGEELGERVVTTVAVSDEEIRKTQEASTKRTQEEMRLVFESNKQRFFSAYRRAQRSDPTLEGTVSLKLEIAPSGKVASCTIGRSELNNEALHKRLLSSCRRMQFKNRPEVQVANVEFPINFIP